MFKLLVKLVKACSDKTKERKPRGSELSANDLSVLNMKQFGAPPTPLARPLNKPTAIEG